MLHFDIIIHVYNKLIELDCDIKYFYTFRCINKQLCRFLDLYDRNKYVGNITASDLFDRKKCIENIMDGNLFGDISDFNRAFNHGKIISKMKLYDEIKPDTMFNIDLYYPPLFPEIIKNGYQHKITFIRCNNELTDNDLSKFINLRKIDLEMNRRITDAGISKLTNLTNVTLSCNNNISISCLQRLPNLRHLYERVNLDNNFSRKSILSLTNLEYLNGLPIYRSQ